jgi:hypothetical protein
MESGFLTTNCVQRGYVIPSRKSVSENLRRQFDAYLLVGVLFARAKTEAPLPQANMTKLAASKCDDNVGFPFISTRSIF